MTAYHQGQPYSKRFDNPPELISALSSWGFPPDFDPAQLPTGMFCCVMDEWSQVKRERAGLPRLPEKTCGEAWPQIKPIEIIPQKESAMTKNKLYIIASIAAIFGFGAYQAGDMPYAAGSMLVAAVVYMSAWATD